MWQANQGHHAGLDAAGSPATVPVVLGSPSYRSVDLPLIRATDAYFPASSKLPCHAHERAILSVILEGGFEVAFGSRTIACGPGSSLVEPAGERHSNRIGACGARVLVLEIQESALVGPLRNCARLFSTQSSFLHPDTVRLSRRLAQQLRSPQPVAPRCVEAAGVELIEAAARRADGGDNRRSGAWLGEVRDYLHAHLDRPIRVAVLARRAGVHRVHLGRAFRERFGESVGAYHRRLRIQWAANELVEGNASVGDIALSAGFADQPHFTRCFKRLLGETPGAYSRQRCPEGR
jgi:AraC family transcriptional regulator